MTLALAACVGGGPAVESPIPTGSVPPVESSVPLESEAPGKTTVAMIAGVGGIDDGSFNQSVWEGVQAYCSDTGKEGQYYQPAQATTNAYVDAIEEAVDDGHEIVVASGSQFEEAVYLVQNRYPETAFILVDGRPHDVSGNLYQTADNTVSILFAEEEVGFLAGYAAVKDGNTKLGFLGGKSVPAVVRYGYGFAQGADAAAAELGISVEMMYYYTGDFSATPEVQSLAEGWYQAGIEVIFGCGGAVGNSVMAAAEEVGGKVIGVDVDQSPLSETVITSAMKSLSGTVRRILDTYDAGQFPGGGELKLGAAEEAVALPMETSRWENFSQADYDTLYAELAAGTIALKTDADARTPEELDCAHVTVNYIE